MVFQKEHKVEKEIRDAIGEASRQRWKDPAYKENMRIKRLERKQKLGYVNSPEARKKLSETWKQKWANGEVTEKQKDTLYKSGKEHKNYIDGECKVRPFMNKHREFRKIILSRDNNCMVCGANKKLELHHIDYCKINHSLENCCILCSHCHRTTNFNREHWIKFFRNILTEKYNYCYVYLEDEQQ